MVKTKTERQPQDLTLRNNRARQKEIAELKKSIANIVNDVGRTMRALGELASRVTELEKRGAKDA